MAQSTQERRKQELSVILDAKRGSVESASTGLSRELSVSYQLRKSVRSHPIPWCAGAFGATLFIGLLVRRPRAHGIVKKSKIGVLLGLGFSLARPGLTKWAAERLKMEAEQRFFPQKENSTLGEAR